MSAARRRLAQRVARALDGVGDRHQKAEARRRLICEQVHWWLEPPHGGASSNIPNAPDAPPPMTWIYTTIANVKQLGIAPSTVGIIHRRYCYRR